MNLNQRKALNIKLANGGTVTFQNALDMFFLPDDQDAFAKAQGYEDAAQMAYYQDMEREAEQLPPPPAEILVDTRETYLQEVSDIVIRAEHMRRAELARIHKAAEIYELAKIDPREVYADSERCPPDNLCWCVDCRPEYQKLLGV